MPAQSVPTWRAPGSGERNCSGTSSGGGGLSMTSCEYTTKPAALRASTSSQVKARGPVMDQLAGAVLSTVVRMSAGSTSVGSATRAWKPGMVPSTRSSTGSAVPPTSSGRKVMVSPTSAPRARAVVVLSHTVPGGGVRPAGSCTTSIWVMAPSRVAVPQAS